MAAVAEVFITIYHSFFTLVLLHYKQSNIRENDV